MDTAGANPRGDHAVSLLFPARQLTPDGLRRIAYDPWMSFFGAMVPALALAWGDLPAQDRLRARLEAPVAMLHGWDQNWAADSQPTSLANFWGEELWALAGRQRPPHGNMWEAMQTLSRSDLLAALDRAVTRMERQWGSWSVPWGEVNRFQRNDSAIVQTFDDARPSIPVPFASARWGSLASFGARLSRHAAVVRDQRQQLRRHRRVRPPHPRLGGHRRRRKRASRKPALQRSGRALRRRRSPPRLFLP